MSQARAVKTTHNGKEVRYIVADLECVSVEAITGSVPNSNKYGINGTFFKMNAAPYDLLGVAVNGGVSVKFDGTKTAMANKPPAEGGGVYTDTERGVLYCFSPLNSGTEVAARRVVNFTDYPGATSSNVKWAIGGISLHLNQNLTKAQYENLVINSPEYAKNFGGTTGNARTAIGYVHASRKSVFLVTFKDASLWDVREFMKSVGCTSGVALDGGGSTQIRYARTINPIGSTTNESWVPTTSTPYRNVQTMVRVNPTTWVESIGF